MSSAGVDDLRPLDADAILGEFRLLAGSRRGEAYMALECERRRIEAMQSAMIAEVSDSSSFLDDSFRSPTDWVQATSNCLRGTANRRLQTAQMLAANPMIAAANLAGALGADQLRMLTDLHANGRARDQLPASQELLVEHARSLTAREFRQVCQRWLAHADPDGAHRDHELSRANRTATINQIGAGFQFRAEGDALTGEVLRKILEAASTTEWELDVAERTARYGPAAQQFPLARTAAQRAFDAFVKLMCAGAGVTDPNNREPLVTIVCTPDVLITAVRDFAERADGADAAGWATGDGPVAQRMRLCETKDGQPVDPRDLVIAAVIGQVNRIVKDSTGRVIDYGRRYRLFRGAARDAVLALGERCSWPGCERRVGLQIDHMTPWGALSGQTNSNNGAPLCGHHNRAKHHRQITIRRDETGWRFYRPDGTEIAPRRST